MCRLESRASRRPIPRVWEAQTHVGRRPFRCRFNALATITAAAVGDGPLAGKRPAPPVHRLARVWEAQTCLGCLLALDSEPAHWCLYPLARVARGRRGPRWTFLRNAPPALAACRAKGAVADRWPQPRHGNGRKCIEFASERAPALRGRPSAALAIRKIARALSLHLKGRRLA